MSKPVEDAIESARDAVAKAVQASMRAITIGIGDRTHEDIKDAFKYGPKDAPLWAHAAVRIAAGVIKAEQASPTVNTSLNIVLVEKASREEWLQMAAPHRSALRQLSGQPDKIIDVAPAVSAEAKK